MVVKRRGRMTHIPKSSTTKNRKSSRKVRLAIQCSPKERKLIKICATHEDQTLNEFVMDSVRMRLSECLHSHEPNEITRMALNETEKGGNLVAYKSLEDFFKSMEK